ncbi:MAG: outer membrane protein assembly factor BamD [Acidobacteriota bacterium]|nr:outer membrane protein assembly factor BamD [Acidobacteriota bacterium]MDH3528145.1 outer membrane protein assembly factor BamD [Acidobacteriota bacterium]
MKKTILVTSLLLLLFSLNVAAQDTEEQLPIGQLLEADAKHNLDVAWQYFRLRKAYIAVLMRTEETMAAHPAFTKMDEILYLSGMSSYYLLNGKGKQKIDLEKMSESDREKFAPERLKEDALAYLAQLIDDYPDSKYADKAKPVLKKLRPEE